MQGEQVSRFAPSPLQLEHLPKRVTKEGQLSCFLKCLAIQQTEAGIAGKQSDVPWSRLKGNLPCLCGLADGGVAAGEHGVLQGREGGW